VTFKFPNVIKTDQIRIQLKKDVVGEQKFKIQLAGVNETVSVRPEARVGILSIPQVGCSEVTFTGNVEILENIEILGIPE